MQEQQHIRNLKSFIGTNQYHQGYLGINLTDGTYYVGVNGASWLITDICSVVKVEKKVKQEPFICIKFRVNSDNSATAIYTDGNEKQLYKQEYKYTDFNKHFEEQYITFYFADNVLMLSSEY